MEPDIKKWIESVLKGQLPQADIERSLAYARDLEQGLKAVRSYPQGVAVFGSARVKETDKFYRKSRELGQLLAQNGHAVVTGGGPGIMEAANRGAYEYGGRSIGLNITLQHEQFPNSYLTDTLTFRYFFARKLALMRSAKVYVFFPGGYGTMDELSEVIELMQEDKMPQMPLFLYGKSFWRPLERFYRSKLLSNKFIQARDLKIFTLTDDVNAIVAAANKVGHSKIGENVYDAYDNPIDAKHQL